MTFDNETVEQQLAICEAATPGPWLWVYLERTGYSDSEGDYCVSGAEFIPDDGLGSIGGGYWDTEDAKFLFTATQEGCSHEDADFISAAREGYPAALKEIQRLRVENGNLLSRLHELARLLNEERLMSGDALLAKIDELQAEIQRLRAELERTGK